MTTERIIANARRAAAELSPGFELTSILTEAADRLEALSKWRPMSEAPSQVSAKIPWANRPIGTVTNTYLEVCSALQLADVLPRIGSTDAMHLETENAFLDCDRRGKVTNVTAHIVDLRAQLEAAKTRGPLTRERLDAEIRAGDEAISAAVALLEKT